LKQGTYLIWLKSLEYYKKSLFQKAGFSILSS
jgi:hypothetical protein